MNLPHCKLPLASNRTRNRTTIIMQNRTCRRPLIKKPEHLWHSSRKVIGNVDRVLLKLSSTVIMGKIHKQEKGRKKTKIGAKDKKTVKTKLV
jgi:hypothetical protein